MYECIGNEIDVESDLDAGIIQLIMEVDGYKPGVDPIPCSNPNSHHFSDPGEGSSFNDVSFKIIVNGHVIILPAEVTDKLYDALECVIDNKLDEVMEAKLNYYNE